LKKFDEEHFDAIVGKAFSKYALVGSLIFLAEIIREDNQNKGEEKYDRPVLIINDYDRLMSPQYLAEKNNEGFNLLQRFFGGLKDCKHFEFVIMTAQEKVPTLLPTNCSHYEAVSEFACTSVEAMKFFNQHHIDVTLEALNQLSFYYCVDKTRYGKNAEYIAKLKSKGFNQMQKHPDFYINTTERWYHPQTLINYVKEKMLDKTLDMTESKNKIFHLPVMSKSPHRLHSFFDLPHHKACDEKEKNVIAADTEVSQQGNVLTPRKC
ncbi:MAG: hypothetical protein JO149_04430, partial [Gammaproteobacteria bacterium]|nr:hypothetical protein [Gammaproteobacteria bacterium]